MWKAFQEEQFNRITLEEDYGFITYELFEDNCAYIHILYVKPEHRSTNLGGQLEDMIIEKHNIKNIYCFVDLMSNSPEQSLNCIFKNGYKIDVASVDKIILKKIVE